MALPYSRRGCIRYQARGLAEEVRKRKVKEWHKRQKELRRLNAAFAKPITNDDK